MKHPFIKICPISSTEILILLILCFRDLRFDIYAQKINGPVGTKKSMQDTSGWQGWLSKIKRDQFWQRC